MGHDAFATPVAVVTGGARGIGLAIGRWFLAQATAWRCWTSMRRRWPRRQRAARRDCAHARCDTRRVGSRSRWRGPVERSWRASAASMRWSTTPASRCSSRSARPASRNGATCWRTNLDGAFLCTQAVAPVMLRAGGGSVVNIASISGLRASTMRVAYGTSKARPDPPDQAAGLRTGQRRHPRQLCRARAGGRPRWQAGAQHGDHPLGLLRHDSAEPLRHHRGDRLGGGFPVQRGGQLRQRPGAGGGRRLRCQRRRSADLAPQPWTGTLT